MEISDISRIVSDAYGINVTNIEKIKNVFKIFSERNVLCLKVIKYEYGHFFFILSAIRHLLKNGFETIPEILKTVEKESFIRLENKFAYLTPWVDARECNYDNPVDINIAAIKLGELHNKSLGFEITTEMKPRVGWFKWIETYNTRKNEILDFKRRIGLKKVVTDFDSLYLEMMEEELERADKAVEDLANSDYLFIMRQEVEKKGFCHHDYAHHNVLISQDNKVNVIDFDYCILDTHLHDLASLMVRRMKNGKWDIENAKMLMDAYNSVQKIERNEIPVMAAFMEFPQEYWQTGIQYYWENQTWGEDFFVKKLEKIKEDREEKQEFIDEFICYK